MMTDLDDLFVQARDQGPKPSDGLMARVLADAAQAQAQRHDTGPKVSGSRTGSGLGAWVTDLLGGAGAMAGVLSAGVAGLVLGYVQPDGLSGLGALLTPATTVSQSLEMMPGLDTLLTEE